MGHRTNLIIRTETEDKYLFEAKNSLPFFWIALLDKNIIESRRKIWQHYDQLITQNDEDALERFTDEMPSPLWLYIDKATFDHNSKQTNLYLQKHYPEALNIFIEFCNHIEKQYDNNDESDDFIMLDIISISAFHDSASQFMEELLLEIKNIKNGKQSNYLDTSDLIASGTGFSCADFEQISVEYQTILKKRNTMFRRPDKTSPPNISFSWKRLIAWLITLLLCPVFSYLTYKGYLKEGYNFRVILLGICNIGFYIFSGWALIGEIQAFFKSGKSDKKI